MNPIKIYWAGDLFDHKDLSGNILLASEVERISGGSYQVCLPQNSESNSNRDLSIRDGDFNLLLNCDAIVANFDGHDLDSGTVVEFCCAKFLDLPAVLLRTDFRRCCEDKTSPDPWNLMCSGYPRSQTLLVHGMNELHRHLSGEKDPVSGLKKYHQSIAGKIVEALNQTIAQPTVLWTDPQRLTDHYLTLLRTLGGQISEALPPEVIRKNILGKIEKGIYNP